MEAFTIQLSHREQVGLHRHDFHEFFFLVEGEGEQYVEDRMYPVVLGDLYFMPAGQTHHGNAAKGTTCLAGVLNFGDEMFSRSAFGDSETARMMERLIEKAWKGENKLDLPSESMEKLRLLFNEMLDELKVREVGCETALKSLVQRWVLTIMRSCGYFDGRRKLVGRRGRSIDDVCHFIEDNYMYPLDVDQLAEKANLSRSRFHVVFTEVTGVSPVRFLNRVRISVARELLKEGTMTLEEIVSHCGFSSISNFYRTFKKETGTSPSKVT